jgi:hypothetical protein
MNIFKAGMSVKEKELVSEILLSDKYRDITEALKNNVSTTDYAKKMGIKYRGSVYFLIESLCKNLSEVSVNFSDLFGTKQKVYNLNININPEWVVFVGRCVEIKRSDLTYFSTSQGDILCDRFFKIVSKVNLDCGFKKMVKKLGPILISDLAKEISCSIDEVQTVIKTLFSEVVIVDENNYVSYVVDKRKGGVVPIIATLLKEDPLLTIPAAYEIMTSRYPKVLKRLQESRATFLDGASGVERLRRSVKINGGESYRKLLINETSNPESCEFGNEGKIVEFCVKHVIDNNFCSTDSYYLSDILSEINGCKIDPLVLKNMLVSSGEFVSGKKFVLAHKSKAGCEKQTLESILEVILKDSPTISPTDAIKELHKRGRVSRNGLFSSNFRALKRKMGIDLTKKREKMSSKKEKRNMILQNVKEYPFSIVDIENPSEEIRIAAVSADGLALQVIEKQNNRINEAAVKQNGLALKFVNRQTFDVAVLAVLQNENAIKYCRRNREEVLKAVASKKK